MRNVKNLALFVLMLGLVSTAATGEIIYVDDDATGANDGSDWNNAYNYLQDALTGASSGDEIWVAEGIYKPDQGSSVVSGDRSASFQLLNGVAVIGGYAGFGALDPDERDVILYETILSGDLNGDDIEVDPSDLLFEPTRAENSYHVVTASLTIASAVLDGFTITGGNATSDGPYSGGGIFNRNPPTPEWECTFEGPTIINCTIYRNSAAGEGGGMYNQYSCQPQIINCTFSENMAGWGGGGIKNDTSSPNITNCDFENNFAGKAGHEFCDGGAIDNEESSPICIDCTFIANSALNYGGAISNWMGNCSPKLVNCIFSKNSAEYGGVMWTSNFHEIGSGSHPELINCTLAENSAVYGNALACTEGPFEVIPSDLHLTNCILWNGGNEIYISDGSTITISYSDIQGGWSGDGNIDVDPLFVDPTNGNYHLLPGSPCIDAGNDAAVPPGVTTDLDGNPRIQGVCVDMGAYESDFIVIKLSGWVFMPPDAPDIGYSWDEGDIVCFFSFYFVQSFNIDTGGWFSHIPMGWIYVDWPFYYESDTGASWFALPPEFGLWVYHFSTSQWELLPRIIP